MGKVRKHFRPLGVFYDLTMLFFMGTKYPTKYLYFSLVFVINLTLKKSYEGEHVHEVYGWSYEVKIREVLIQIENYCCNFSVILTIVSILGTNYIFMFVKFDYKRLYGKCYGVSKLKWFGPSWMSCIIHMWINNLL